MKRFKTDLWENRAAIVIIVVYLSLMQIMFNEVCPLKLLIGIPCPGCGLTRGCMSFLMMQWQQSIAYNPVSVLWMVAIVYFLIERYIICKPINPVFVIVLALVTFAVYFWRMLVFYPGAEPMSYYENNLAATLNILKP